jgi:hypothetical protein
MLAFQIRGWEIVASRVSDALLQSFESRATRLVHLGDGRCSIELPAEIAPDGIVAELTAGGATLLTLNPIRETLEDYFVQQVSRDSATRHATIGQPSGQEAR